MRDYDQVNHCLSPRYGSLSDYKAASSLGYGMNSADAGLWAETDNATYDPFCPASDCSTAQLSDFITAKNAYTTSLNAANTIVTALQDNSSISATDVSSLLTAQSLTADSDLDLNDNPIHLSYVQACMSGKTDPAQLAACAANVDGQDLNRYAVAEILSGAQSGTVDQTVLVNAGISSAVAQIAAGTTRGPNQDQSCLTEALGGIEGKSDVTQANFETVLADYFTAAVAEEPTTVATHSVNTGCPGGETTFWGAEPAVTVREFRELELFVQYNRHLRCLERFGQGQPAGRYQQLCGRDLFTDSTACDRQHHVRASADRHLQYQGHECRQGNRLPHRIATRLLGQSL